MDEKARGEAVAESAKRLVEEFSPKASTLVPKFSELLIHRKRSPFPHKGRL